MSLIRIFSTTGIEIEYKKDSLSLKKENNALSSDFKVPHSSFPFLVIENDVAKNILGPSDITSIRKNKIVPVVILENGVRYYGELQQLTVIPKFRKCNLKYGSDIIPIVNKKIAEFLPTISIIPDETNPIPFTENGTTILSGNELWGTFPVNSIGKFYPEVKFNFPTLYWLNKYGVDLEDTDPWYLYQNHINKFGTNEANETIFIRNEGHINGLSPVTVFNRNVPVPHLFLLTPLHYIFESLGWKISGNFTTHELIVRLLLGTNKDNICKTILSPPSETITFINEPSYWTHIVTSVNEYFRIFIIKNIPIAGTYKVVYSFEVATFNTSAFSYKYARFFINPAGESNQFFVFSQWLESATTNTITISGGVEFYAEAGDCVFFYEYPLQQLPINYSIELIASGEEKEFHQMHPTINLGRYAPDWTVGTYLNNLKNQFNLDITLDDFKKEISLNLNETIHETEEPAIISQSLTLKSYDIAAHSSFVLKYENDEDLALFIKQGEIITYTNQDDDFTKKIESKFKLLPRNGYTSVLSEDIQDKDGVALLIYNEANAPFTSETTTNNFNLNIAGEKGIYDTFFKRWLKFLLNASNCEVIGYFTEIEISKINKAKSVYINNQRFRIIDIETTEASNNYQQVKMQLLSVNY